MSEEGIEINSLPDFLRLWALTANALPPLVFSQASGLDSKPLLEDSVVSFANNSF